MNARIGKSDAKGSVYNVGTNENGRRLLDYMQECGLKALNNIYRKRKGKLWTHILPRGSKSQIDYILINEKWKNSALNCEAYKTFYTVGSDHRIVTAKVRLSLRQNKPPITKKTWYDWSRLLSDDHIKERYSIEVNNQLQVLQNLEDISNSNEIYNNIIQAHEEAAKKHIPEKNKVKQHVPWENENIVVRRRAVRDALNAVTHRETRSNVKKLQDAKIQLEEAYTIE